MEDKSFEVADKDAESTAVLNTPLSAVLVPEEGLTDAHPFLPRRLASVKCRLVKGLAVLQVDDDRYGAVLKDVETG
jgi:hypothetical protein